MKKILYHSLMLLAVSVLLWACEKEETRAVLREGVTPTLTTSATNLVLKQEDAAKPAVTFNWGAVDYGFADAIGYVLQVSKSGTNFASANTVEIGVLKSELKKDFTVGELNAELNKILTPGVAQEVEVRLKSNTITPFYSNTLKMTVTPYRVRIFYTYPQALNVAGNYQGWAPDKAPQLVSLSNDGVYEGFFNFSNEAEPTFKFVKGDNWGAGDYGTGGTGKLGSNGDLKITTGAGIYYVKADVPKMEWSSRKINTMGLIGGAIPGTGWDSDRDMTFDPATGLYSITLDLNAGEIKFRANDNWDFNLGDNNNPNDGRPEIGGNNIKIDAAGNYTITLDLLIGGNWVYTIKKN